MTRPPSIGVRPAALPAWQALTTALQQSPPVPCAHDDRFTSDNPADRAEAAELCTSCPVRELCETFADANREVHHTWAGTDRTPGARHRTRQKRKDTAA